MGSGCRRGRGYDWVRRLGVWLLEVWKVGVWRAAVWRAGV